MIRAMQSQLRWVIGHRGACGHWPENTWRSIEGAHALGADWVEVDAVLSRDGVVVLSHDIWLESTTDVAVRFPARARADGHFYAIDFDWAELRELGVGASRDAAGRVVHAGRKLEGAGETGVCRLVDVVSGLMRLASGGGRVMGLVVEVKSPAWHADQGADLGWAVLGALAEAGDLPVVVETFDAMALQTWRRELPAGAGWRWWQLLGENEWAEAACDYDAMRTVDGLRDIAGYADGIAINLARVTEDLAAQARACGLTVCGYTLRTDDAAGWSLERLAEAGLDGVFTDQPGVLRSWLDET